MQPSAYLPIVWAIVATAIGLALYRSSSALFESSELPGLKAKKIRLTGSVVIAAGAFIGMWKVTPQDAIAASRSDVRIISTSKLVDQRETISQLEGQLVELNACAEMVGSLTPCAEYGAQARATARRVRLLAEQMLASEEGATQ